VFTDFQKFSGAIFDKNGKIHFFTNAVFYNLTFRSIINILAVKVIYFKNLRSERKKMKAFQKQTVKIRAIPGSGPRAPPNIY